MSVDLMTAFCEMKRPDQVSGSFQRRPSPYGASMPRPKFSSAVSGTTT